LIFLLLYEHTCKISLTDQNKLQSNKMCLFRSSFRNENENENENEFKEENMVLNKIGSTLIERQVSFTDSTHYNIYGNNIII
jgi:hypothetical protein